MFIGHYAAGFAAKNWEPRLSLGTTFFAANWIDLLFSLFVLLGIERVKIVPGFTVVAPLDLEHYPYTHSLLAVVGWALLFGGVHFFWKRHLKSALILGACVLSHWFLDAIVHIPDLPLSPWSQARIGLGLWNSPWGTAIVEMGLFWGAVGFYLWKSKGPSLGNRLATQTLVWVLFLLYLGSLSGQAPPSAQAMATVGLFQGLFLVWAALIDRKRVWQ